MATWLYAPHAYSPLVLIVCCVAPVVYLFYEFDKFWLAEKPADIMQFNVVKDKFVDEVSELLRRQDTRLALEVTASS